MKNKLKAEFEAQQKKAELANSKKAASSPARDEGEEAKTKKKKLTKIEQKEIDIIKRQQEDAFFDKWLKQREAQGLSVKKRIIGNERGSKNTKRIKKTTITKEEEVEEGGGGAGGKPPRGGNRGTTPSGAGLTSGGEGAENGGASGYATPGRLRKTKEGAELRKLQEQAELKETLAHMQIEERKVRKECDVDIITSKTIEALLKYLGIEPDDSQTKLDSKFNKQRIEIQGQKPTKVKKQTHVVPKEAAVKSGAGGGDDLERDENAPVDEA